MKALKWIPPCGCVLYLMYEISQSEVWENNPRVHNMSKLCKSHSKIQKGKSRDVCWTECKKVSSVLRNLVQINPNIEETIPSSKGEIKRYLFGVEPLEVSWSGEGENRKPTVKINKNLKGFVTKSQVRQVKERVSKEFTGVDISEDGL